MTSIDNEERMTGGTSGRCADVTAAKKIFILQIDSLYSFLSYNLPFDLIDFQITQQNILQNGGVTGGAQHRASQWPRRQRNHCSGRLKP
jgi:hypothetical protein